MSISISQKGDYEKLDAFFKKAKKSLNYDWLEKYGKQGADALRKATPIDTGFTAVSWDWRINRQKKQGVSLEFYNTNIQNGVNIAIILQYGHGTRNGGYVVGRDYINPAIEPIFEQILEDIEKEMREMK